MIRKQKTNGLTLIELLMAVAIVAILSAGLYVVGSRVETQAKIKQTQSTIEILSTAIEQYRNFYGKLPDANDANGMPIGYGSLKPGEKWYYKLSTAPDAKIILNQINSSLIKDADGNRHPVVVDAWGNYLHYSYISGNNFPVIDSNGPDKVRGNSDDITSR